MFLFKSNIYIWHTIGLMTIYLQQDFDVQKYNFFKMYEKTQICSVKSIKIKIADIA
jgi:hypothetical protein